MAVSRLNDGISVRQQGMCRDDYLEAFVILFRLYEWTYFSWKGIQGRKLYPKE